MQDWMIAGLVLSLMTALPLAWKWQLGVLRAAVVISAFAAVSALIVGSLRNAVAIADWICGRRGLAAERRRHGGAAGLSLLPRSASAQAPDRDDVIVSPADGVVIYVRKSEGGCCRSRTSTAAATRSPSSPRPASRATTPSRSASA